MQDAARHPQLFVWNGAIESNQLEVWLQEHQLNLPQDLIELMPTGGGTAIALVTQTRSL